MGTACGFGVDVGGSGIKGCPVDIDGGELAEERMRVSTPQPSTPGAVADAVAEIVDKFGWQDRIGITLPCVVKDGTALTAANVDHAWIGTDAQGLFAERLGKSREDVVVLNDADAAGMAELRSGAAAGHSGLVLVLTFGTGIGSALFMDGHLIPNTEFGHTELDGEDAENVAAASVKENLDLSYQEWAPHVNRYLQSLERFVWPDLIVAGGGVSKKAHKWVPLLQNRTPVVAAGLRNDAGIIGAATAAAAGI
ncbi:polyphosphate--glucose phosphotransferase [Bounagaea algeriensis]